jgi:acetyl esterase/lipase
MLTVALAVLLQAAAPAPDDAKPLVLDLWPGRPPGDPENVEAKETPGDKGPKRVDGVAKPTIAVYRPPAEKNTGAAIVVCPGGGYRMLAFEHEGTDVAAWLVSIGVSCVLLKYRVPQRPGDADNLLPLQDAQRALSLTRSRASEWSVDPARIGILGFSAGGHLSANASTNFTRRAYEAVDAADQASCRPDFAVLVYPGGILDKQDPRRLRDQIRVSKEMPPCLFVVSSDDKGSAAGTILMAQAVREAGVPMELHVYSTGGHGYGMRKGDKPHHAWPQRAEEWMRNLGVLKAK